MLVALGVGTRAGARLCAANRAGTWLSPSFASSRALALFSPPWQDLMEGGYNVHVLADGTSSSRHAERMIALQVACRPADSVCCIS